MDLTELKLYVDDVPYSFEDWTMKFVNTHYPKIGEDCYRVPALHFDQQKIKEIEFAQGGLKSLKIQQPQKLEVSFSDIAHSIILEGFENLSHHLRLLNLGPIFIISSVKFENCLAKLRPPQSRRRRKKQQDTDSGSLNTVPTKRTRTTSDGDDFPPESDDVGERVRESESEKQSLPPILADKGKRMEIDVMLLHERCGMILVEVKATGYPSPEWKPSEEEFRAVIIKSIRKAQNQLKRAREMLPCIMPHHLTFTRVTMIVALPFLTTEQVNEARSSMLDLEPSLLFLCKEDLQPSTFQDPATPPQAAAATATAEKSVIACQSQQDDAPKDPVLLAWWRSNVESAEAQGLSVDSMRTIVGRICGPMSVVSVWTISKPRIEVRTQSQALWEAGRRMSDIILLPDQAELLAQQTLHRVWLTGPVGSGKTLMLQLKGQQWVREGRRVVVINVRTIARGRPIGHVLEEAIRQALKGHSGAGSVDRFDVALDEYSIDDLHQQLVESGPMDQLCFMLDEVLSGLSVIAEHLALRYSDSPVWCVASYVTLVPSNFQEYWLGANLRNPPSVQLMLKELDLNPRHRNVYTIRSAARGLPCDGPPVIFIEHSKHNTCVRQLDCLQCADELADIFKNKLELQLRPPKSSESSAFDSSSVPSRSCKTTSALQLSFRDVLILSAVPHSTYRHVADYHWEPSIPELFHYIVYMGKCRFLTRLRERGVPLKIAVDNTLKEIVFPPKDEVIMADIMGAHSLERKVVVFLRGGGPMTEAEVLEHRSRYQAIKDASSVALQSGQSNPDCPANKSSHQDGIRTGQEGRLLKEEGTLFALMMHEIRDILYPQLPESVPADPRTVINALLGNMAVARTRSFVEGREQEEQYQRKVAWSSETPSSHLRVGSEIRASLSGPEVLSHTAPGSTSAGNQPQNRVNVVEADSVVLAPEIQDALGRESEVNRIKQALGALTEDDKDWEYLAASRCLCQYITILP